MTKGIYEGDIVEYISIYIVRNGIVKIPDNEDYGENIISGFYLEDADKLFPGSSHIDILERECEVIGNIYENPKLIKDIC